METKQLKDMPQLQKALLVITKLKQQLAELKQQQQEPIAVVGMACRFPGGGNPEEFWEFLQNGGDAMRDIPKERWDAAQYYDAKWDMPGKMYVNKGAFINEIDQFDASFFNISPREAAGMDPQQRLLLEVSYEALCHAGIAVDSLIGSDTGVFLGIMNQDYMLLNDGGKSLDMYTGAGNAFSATAGRLSFFYGLQGPCVALDTACSSSLVAVDAAIDSLRNHKSNLALAAGVNLILSPDSYIAECQAHMLSPDGACKTFDQGANGFARGEGCGVLILKRLSEAEKAGDKILGLIRGTAVNQDGASSGLTVPNGIAQREVIQKALANAGLTPQDIDYVEAHGTGTELGDPIEMRSLLKAYATQRTAEHSLLVGSVKTNIGHLESAAGIVGLSKVLLSLQHEQIPPHIRLKTINPKIELNGAALEIPTERRAWPRTETPRRAGVSSFGFSGTNAHVIVEEAPLTTAEPLDAAEADQARILCISAKSEAALTEFAEKYADYLQTSQDSWRDITYTASLRRSHFDYRLALTATDSASAQAQLRQFLQGAGDSGVSVGRARSQQKVFVYSGSGSQWLGMGRELFANEAVFKAKFTECDQIFQELAGWSLIEAMTSDDAERFKQTEVYHPLILAIQLALTEQLKSWGVRPEAVVGHSMGEVAAACVAGALSLKDAFTLMYHRSRLIQRVQGKGKVLSVNLKPAEVSAYLKDKDGLSIAGNNSPGVTVVAGEPTEIEALHEEFAAQKIYSKIVAMDFAAHSVQMDPLQAELVAALQGLKPQVATLPIYSTVTGEEISGESLNADYWGRNLREPFEFAKATKRLSADGYQVFVEVGGHPVLAYAIETTLGDVATVVATLKRDAAERTTLRNTLAQLYVNGEEIAWEAFYAQRGQLADLPHYPWQKQRYWLDFKKKAGADGQHPLLGSHTYLANINGMHVWENELSAEYLPYLKDHQVHGKLVVPGAVYMEMALSAAQELFKGQTACIKDQLFVKPLILPETGAVTIQVQVSPVAEGGWRYEIYSAGVDESEEWDLHATGQLEQQSLDIASVTWESLAQRRWQAVELRDLYQDYAEIGLEYGEQFQNLVELKRHENEILGELRCTDEVSREAGDYVCHPALLDGCLQMIGALLGDSEGATYLPAGVAELSMQTPLEGEAKVHIVVSEQNEAVVKADIYIYKSSGDLCGVLRGFEARQLDVAKFLSAAEGIEENFYELKWEEQVLTKQVEAPVEQNWLLVSSHESHSAVLAAALVSQGQSVETVTLDQLESSNRKTQQYEGLIYIAGDQTAVDESVHVLKLVQGLTSGRFQAAQLIIITQHAQSVANGIELQQLEQSSLWGLGRVIELEHPELNCRRIDSAGLDSASTERLLDELLAPSEETQVAYRYGKRHVARLVKSVSRTAERIELPLEKNNYEIRIGEKGLIDNLELRRKEKRALQPDEVRIVVKSAALNFRDVMYCLGQLDGLPGVEADEPLGGECSGIVTELGANVSGLVLGDEVVALAHGSFSDEVITLADLVTKKPSHLSWSEAAGIPVVYLTVYYAFERLAQLQAGQTVLIHSAAGGVGLAAVQIAQAKGATVYATAGTEEKRALLRSLGVQAVWSSREAGFEAGIQQMTDGAGVDIILNSLTGEHISAGLRSLKPGGQFLEIGKVDVWQEEQVKEVRADIAYHVIYLDRMMREDTQFIRTLFQDLCEYLAAEGLNPHKTTVFAVEEVKEAFRYMARGHHMGKVVLSLPDTTLITDTGSYLVTGGLGALGQVACDWLIEHGAKHIVLSGRSEPKPEVAEHLQELKEQGVCIEVVRGDIAEREAAAAMLAKCEELAPLHGIIHAAGVLADGILIQQDAEKFHKVFSPKVEGATHLHELTQDKGLAFTVYYSSMASLLGNGGQGNYAAANAYLDELAKLRSARGQRTLSINWGAWGEVGLAATDKVDANVAGKGIRFFSPEEGMQAFESSLERRMGQIAFAPIQWRQLAQALTGLTDNKYLAELMTSQHSQGLVRSAILEKIETTAMSERQGLMESYLRGVVAKTLGITNAETIPLDKGFFDLGMDSLMAVELKNRIERELNLRLLASLIFDFPDIAALAAYLSKSFGGEVAEDTHSVSQKERHEKELEQSLHDEVSQLSEQDEDKLLAELLASD